VIEYREELITAKEVEAFLKRKKKTRFWFHNIGTRYNLLPPPIIKVNRFKIMKILPGHVKKELKKLKGRFVYYHREILPYLTLIIDLKDIKGLTFASIAKNERVIKELNRLKYLSSTNLFVNPLDKGGGFLTNFRVAKRMLLERYGVGADGILSDVLTRIVEETRRDYDDYLQINKKIRNHALHYEEIDQELEKEKTKLAFSINVSNKIMEATTAVMVERMRKKEITHMDWKKMADEVENEDRKAGIIK